MIQFIYFSMSSMFVSRGLFPKKPSAIFCTFLKPTLLHLVLMPLCSCHIYGLAIMQTIFHLPISDFFNFYHSSIHPLSWIHFSSPMTSKYVVIALHRLVVNLMNPTRSAHLYHFSLEQILAWTQHNLACPLTQQDSPKLHLTILEQVCLCNHIPEAQIHVLLNMAQNWQARTFFCPYGHSFWSNHPFEAEVLLYLNQHQQYHQYDPLGHRHIIYPEPECSDIDNNPEPVAYFNSENDIDLDDYNSDDYNNDA